MKIKRCARCKNFLPIEEFNKNKSFKDGYSHYCRKCMNSYRRERWKDWKQDKIHQRNQYKRRVSLDLCPQCAEKSLKNIILCIDCWFKRVSYHTFSTSKKWKQIKKIAEKQNYTCVYTGKKLIPGTNMSIDHKIPKFLNGSNKLKNLQWTLKKVNIAKNKLTHKDFIQMCIDIVKFAETGNNG